MIIFILSDLLLAFLVETKSEFLELLNTPIAQGMALTAMVISLLLGYLKKVPTMIWHDGFASATLIVWYAFWKPLFLDEPLMFLIYPLYFAVLSAILTMALINKSPYFDQQSIEHLRYLEKIMRLDINTAIGFVLISLIVSWHYALFAVAMTFFIVRHAIAICMETVEN